MEALTLKCPIRGVLTTRAKSQDGLKPSEEYYRIQAIKHLISLGYPKENFKVEVVVKRFGNSGRNSLRADFVVLDVPVSAIPSGDIDTLLDHTILLGEVKREKTAQTEYVKNTQVKPLLDFAKLQPCIAVYWDNVDHRVFWAEWEGNKKLVKEGPLAFLPTYGHPIHVHPLRFENLNAVDNLIALFDRIEDILHAASIDLDQRFSVILQLLLAKLYDEHAHQSRPLDELDVQDYQAMGYVGKTALIAFNRLLAKAVGYYQNHLPRPVDKHLPAKITGEVLFAICKLLAPVLLIASKRDVIQAFYMKFARGLYKWDLAQFFTPPTVTDFIVDVLNPQFGEHIKDPACGSADFLTAAFHKGRQFDARYSDCVWGSDNSQNAVQVAVLNMLLNGDGKSNIKEVDSLAHVNDDRDRFNIMVCNPPFGVRIVEKRRPVLRHFDLGFQWKWDDGKKRYTKLDSLLDAQEAGLLFAEACVIQAQPHGRIAIILPNGYLANRSKKYHVFREWLLRHTRIAAICSFPRFTFKTSGADVSASVVYLEKRPQPLNDPRDDDTYRTTIQMIENVGWNLGDKNAAPRYRRNPEDGSYIVGDDGNRLLDADFSHVLDDLRQSAAVNDFPWLTTNTLSVSKDLGWSISIKDVLNDNDYTLDPKRHCQKINNLRESLSTHPHFILGEAVHFLPEQTSSTGNKVPKDNKILYRYAELQDIGQGDFRTNELRGWELPNRARHFAEAGDLYVGAIWGSVSKWCLIPQGISHVVVTNGCHRMRIKPGMEKRLVDIVAFFCSEAYSVQMRSLARGSDGLAEISADDAKGILVPELTPSDRDSLEPFVRSLLTGIPGLQAKVSQMLHNQQLAYPHIAKRPSHVVLV